MTDLTLNILLETPEDAAAIERLYERTFGPGRFARTSYRIREEMAHRPELSFTARIGTLLVAELADGAFAGVSGAIRPDWDQESEVRSQESEEGTGHLP